MTPARDARWQTLAHEAAADVDVMLNLAAGQRTLNDLNVALDGRHPLPQSLCDEWNGWCRSHPTLAGRLPLRKPLPESVSKAVAERASTVHKIDCGVCGTIRGEQSDASAPPVEAF